MSTCFGFKQFREQFCLSYILFDRQTKEALVIDPSAALMPDYRHFLAEQGLKPVWAIDTHLHSEHFSATHLFGKEYGCRIGMGGSTRSSRVTDKLLHGRSVEAGALKFQVLLTPGHTADSVALYCAEMNAVFSGDALLLGDANPPELSDADPLAQWKSFQEVFGQLSAKTVVLPAHDASELLFGLIGVERKKNLLWKISETEEFVRSRKLIQIMVPDAETQKILDYNLATEPMIPPQRQAGKTLPYGERNVALDRMATISLRKFSAKVKKPEVGNLILDIRETEAFLTGKIPASKNIPLSELGTRLPELEGFKKIFVCGSSDGMGALAARTLTYIGLPDVWLVEGGVRGWAQAGYKLEDCR